MLRNWRAAAGDERCELNIRKKIMFTILPDQAPKSVVKKNQIIQKIKHVEWRQKASNDNSFDKTNIYQNAISALIKNENKNSLRIRVKDIPSIDVTEIFEIEEEIRLKIN